MHPTALCFLSAPVVAIAVYRRIPNMGRRKRNVGTQKATTSAAQKHVVVDLNLMRLCRMEKSGVVDLVNETEPALEKLHLGLTEKQPATGIEHETKNRTQGLWVDLFRLNRTQSHDCDLLFRRRFLMGSVW